MNGYYPVALQLRGKKIVVVGGGAVAERKVTGLLEAGADDLIVVSPAVTERIASLAAQGLLRIELRSYAENDACGARLLFAATSDKAVNAAAAADGERYGALVNASDSYGQGDFLVPSVIRRGDLLLSVTAAGASPAFAAAIKRELETQYGEAYGAAASRLRRLRKLVLGKGGLDRQTKQAVLKLAAEEAADAARSGVWMKGSDKDESDDDWLSSLLHRIDRRHT